MKAILAAALVILSLLLVPQLSAASPVAVTLSLPHDHVLPGVPFDLVVTYTNVSNRTLTIDGATATLVVTFANGETTVMHWPEQNDQSSFGFAYGPAHLRPGQSVQQAMGWEGGVPNWFKYESFSGPGTYSIALDLLIVDESHEAISALRTPAVPLTVVEPAGIDAELWKRMQQTSGGKWSDVSFNENNRDYAALADEIVQLHPASGYYPYILSLRAALLGPHKTPIQPLLEASERFQNSPAYPHLLVAAAESARYAGTVAARQGRVADAEEHFALADTKYREALATKSGVVVRFSSERGLQELTWRRERLTRKPAR
jgi:hypothetical protein